MKRLQYITLLALLPFLGISQTLTEAVNFSTYDVMGTARTVGVGGAFGAMGGDYSAVVINPAGIGEYKKSEFTFTPGFGNNEAEGFFVQDPNSISRRDVTQIGLDNIAYVYAGTPNSDKWLNSNFVIGYNRLNDFKSDYSLSGTTQGSITERFVELANGKSPEQFDDFEAGLAWDVYAINPKDDGSLDYTDNFYLDDQIEKRQIVNQRGSLSEISIGWAGNYNNKLNLGATIGIPFISFEETKSYNQTLNIDDFYSNLNYFENNIISGTGVNLKLGAIYKPVQALRLGIALHTPSVFVMNNEFNTTMDYTYTGDDGTLQGPFSSESPLGSFKYNLTTPMRVIGSIGTIFKAGQIAGFINLDYENINYANASYDLTNYSDSVGDLVYSDELNEEIGNQLTSANNIKIGTELGYREFRIRGGYNLIYSAYEGEDEVANAWSIGTGFSGDNFFIDVAYRQSSTESGYIPYYVLDSERDPLANITNTRGRVVMTIGFRL